MLMKLDAWPPGRLQDVLALLDAAGAAGVTDLRSLRDIVADQLGGALVARVRTKRPGKRTRPRLTGGPVRCRACGAVSAMVERVNVCGSTRVPGPWKSSISCHRRECLHVELSELTVDEAIASWL